MRVLATLTTLAAGAAAAILGAPDAHSTTPTATAAPAPLLAQLTPAPAPLPVETASAPLITPAATPADAQTARLIAVARAELERLGPAIPHHDRVAIANFSRPSAEPRLFLVDLEAGTVDAFRVTHGKGSDRGHSGRLQAFSGVDGSEATSRGAYRTAELYTGQHGRSMRLDGLDADNRSARARAIVIHAAAYAEPSMVAARGMLGRSQGCFALSSADLSPVLDFLGQGRLLFADRL